MNPADRRISGRVEEIVSGWWRQPGGKFEKCKTLDLSMDGALIVVNTLLDEGLDFELHLDMESEWSAAFEATILWQRPIFFGKQQLTAVKYRFKKSEDRSLFGLWLQRRLAAEKKPGVKITDPVVLNEPKPSVEPSIEPAPRLSLRESRWKKTFSQLAAKVPWTEPQSVPEERRKEPRGQVGLTVVFEWGGEHWRAEFLNVGMSGVCLFVPRVADGDEGLPALKKDEVVELVLPELNLLVGRNRCPATVVWKKAAELERDKRQTGLVLGLQFNTATEVKKSFVGDLLKRINYSLRQARSEVRITRVLPVIVAIGKVKYEGITVDISAGGASLRLAEDLETPQNIQFSVNLEMSEGKEDRWVTLSSRLLRCTVDKQGRNCYAVAFRRGQEKEQTELSRWLAQQLGSSNINELIPNFSAFQKGM